MATDTMALAEAIQIFLVASRIEDAMGDVNGPHYAASNAFLRRMAGRALLAALSGVPERIAALEGVELAAREIPVTRYLSNPHEITWRLDAVEAALDALDALAGEGAG